ncbi:MAG: malate dehydrogenase, partial [Candidatus Bathyarchaeota archaeon]
ANTRTAYVLFRAGFKPGNLILVDTKGILHAGRPDLEKIKEGNPWKYELSEKTNAEGRRGSIEESFDSVDAVIGASKPGPGTIKKDWVKKMATDSIVFACANPVPEIWPWEAKEAGARIVGTGRSDFPNQINNSLGFPAIFRGVLDVKATTVTDDMCVAAARELALFAEERGIHENDVAPRMEEWEVFPREAVACALQSIKEGVARIKPSKQELWEGAVSIIKNARDSTHLLMKKGFIPAAPKPEDILGKTQH